MYDDSNVDDGNEDLLIKETAIWTTPGKITRQTQILNKAAFGRSQNNYRMGQAQGQSS